MVRRKPGVVVEWFDDQAVAFEPAATRVARLDSVRARLLDCLDGSIDRATLVGDIAAAAVIPTAEAERLLDQRIEELAAAGFVDFSETTDAPA